jgi:polyisoprenoid-binding protein YceI
VTNHSTRARNRLFQSAALIAMLALLGVSFWSKASADDTTPTPGVIGTPAATNECGTADATVTPSVTPAAVFQIASEDSEARYVAEEELANKGANTAVGKTNAFIGQILLDDQGRPLACSRFDVDLRTLVSDESRRDNFLYSNTLETQTYPLATFIMTGVQGLDKPLADGDETQVQLVGNLTVHGQTKLVVWDAKVKMDGDTLTGTASTSFNMADFNITPPKVGPVMSIDETVKLEVDITAKKA